MSRYIRKCLDWYAKISPKKPIKVPYGHVVQIGDPILRKKCQLVPEINMTSNETRKIINTIKYVMKNFNCVGLAAPQIGVNVRIFAMEFNEKHIQSFNENQIREMEMSILPLMVFINPTIKVIDCKQITHIEGCASINGYCAQVPRYKEIRIDAFNESGEEVSANFSGWPARIIQHEMNHLDGIVYTDIMDSKSFSFLLWDDVNKNGGNITLPFYSK